MIKEVQEGEGFTMRVACCNHDGCREMFQLPPFRNNDNIMFKLGWSICGEFHLCPEHSRMAAEEGSCFEEEKHP